MVILCGLLARFVNAVASTWALMARAGAETENAFSDWNVGNIMTLRGSETSMAFPVFYEEVRLVDYAETQELDSHPREQDCTRDFPICHSTVRLIQ